MVENSNRAIFLKPRQRRKYGFYHISTAKAA